MTTAEQPAPLSVGAVLGDYNAENNAWKSAINELGRQVMELREGMSSPLNVNIVFHVQGRLAPNEFSGVRTGRFSKKNSHLMVQAAVPSSAAEDRTATLLRLLADAIDEAEAFARKKKIASELTEIRTIQSRLT